MTLPLENQSPPGRFLKLVVPWASVLLVAMIGAAVSWQQHSAQLHSFNERILVHEPDHVFNEEHAPLHPLDKSDFIGFFLAIIGLMVAVSIMTMCLSGTILMWLGAPHIMLLNDRRGAELEVAESWCQSTVLSWVSLPSTRFHFPTSPSLGARVPTPF
mmetsp:Transcript_15890/g.32857  ORF Transcript_15890/g.32857 Transcript_15890/m.32857 type:complete len:158 (+) Transcript_15890:145-618(+)